MLQASVGKLTQSSFLTNYMENKQLVILVTHGVKQYAPRTLPKVVSFDQPLLLYWSVKTPTIGKLILIIYFILEP
jgi:hypothetical protein